MSDVLDAWPQAKINELAARYGLPATKAAIRGFVASHSGAATLGDHQQYGENPRAVELYRARVAALAAEIQRYPA